MKQNPPKATNEDINFFRCKRCGFPIDLSRDKEAPYASITYTALTGVTGADNPKNDVINVGCPFCGTPNYRNWEE